MNIEANQLNGVVDPDNSMNSAELQKLFTSLQVSNLLLLFHGFSGSDNRSNATLTANQTGTYFLTVWDNNNCQLNIPEPGKLSLFNIPDPVISGETEICVGEDLQLYSNIPQSAIDQGFFGIPGR